ncbi:long-chain-fatty-acid--CoA ligase [Hydrogenophaga sp. BPS33]|uniref:long-chain-fatty-acid--CoA ligase n=1 Tax=Hydrogenophaga sp. BPS33 TaxID=2651974 RepID=UPI00131F56FF|nr:long-chain-fatty-acid--CoA ligase [Hydrogenophaga sp. BPS33]QHE84619.1 long-chain-fatty-acid--CoA ligase [Hydrogenophaga sp. BPS33]
MSLTLSLQRSLQQTPARTATIFGTRRRSFREHGDRVARLAAALRSQGLQANDRVGILAHNSDRFLECIMGVWWAGGVLNPVNIRWSVPEIVYSLDDCDTRILIVDKAFAALAPRIGATARHAPLFVYADDGAAPPGMLSFEDLMEQHEPVEDAGRSGNDLACIMYTGGTTGHPKGVMQSHMNLWSAATMRLSETPILRGSTSLHVVPLFHIAGLGRVVMQSIAGECQAVLPGFDAGAVLEIIERERITDTVMVPTMIQAVLNHPDFDQRDLSSWRRLGYGASPSASVMVEQAVQKLPNVELSHAYGLTEACPVISSSGPAHHSEDARKSGLSRSAGHPAFGVLVRIVDAGGREVPRGVVGEITARGPNIMLGYWNKPEETAKALRDGWLFTGDGGYLDADGNLFIVDRIKDMIVSGGENIYSAEVENAIAQHPAVAMCAVIGIPHEKWGEAVHAVVVCKPGAELDEEAVRTHCRERIAGYKCPKTVAFRDALPLSSAGKILKRDLREPFWAHRGSA